MQTPSCTARATGGFEAFFLLGVGMISNIVTAVMLNAGMADTLTAAIKDPAALQQMNAAFAGLASTAPPLFLVSIVERLAAVVLQVSLSVLVWFAAKSMKQFWLYPLAVLLHLAIDAVAVILAGNGVNIWLVEGVVYVIAAVSAVLAVTVWRRNRGAQNLGSPVGTGLTSRNLIKKRRRRPDLPEQ